MTIPTRPLVRYHGGKWRLAPWLLSLFPHHRKYVEPYGGGASVLLRKNRAYAEVYNDLDGEIVNLFQVARDRGDDLRLSLELTPYARDEYVEAWFPSADPIEQARRTLIRSYMGRSSASVTMGRAPADAGRGGLMRSGFRADTSRAYTIPAHDWANYPAALDAIIQRLRGVVIENRPALAVMAAHESPETLIYADPPYVAETRDKGGDYAHEMTNSDHEALAEFLNNTPSMVVLSGYASPLYERLYATWQRFEKPHMADGAEKRTEVVWCRNLPAGDLFDWVPA